MNRGLWISRKNYLITLIKKVSIEFGGDSEDFINLHCKQVIDMCPDDKIEDAILCYEEMVKQINK